eukprot:3073184-Rhodomonas_salina.3
MVEAGMTPPSDANAQRSERRMTSRRRRDIASLWLGLVLVSISFAVVGGHEEGGGGINPCSPDPDRPTRRDACKADARCQHHTQCGSFLPVFARRRPSRHILPFLARV